MYRRGYGLRGRERDYMRPGTAARIEHGCEQHCSRRITDELHAHAAWMDTMAHELAAGLRELRDVAQGRKPWDSGTERRSNALLEAYRRVTLQDERRPFDPHTCNMCQQPRARCGCYDDD